MLHESAFRRLVDDDGDHIVDVESVEPAVLIHHLTNAATIISQSGSMLYLLFRKVTFSFFDSWGIRSRCIQLPEIHADMFCSTKPIE